MPGTVAWAAVLFSTHDGNRKIFLVYCIAWSRKIIFQRPKWWRSLLATVQRYPKPLHPWMAKRRGLPRHSFRACPCSSCHIKRQMASCRCFRSPKWPAASITIEKRSPKSLDRCTYRFHRTPRCSIRHVLMLPSYCQNLPTVILTTSHNPPRANLRQPAPFNRQKQRKTQKMSAPRQKPTHAIL